MARNFPIYQQHDATDCGATCLRMIARHYGRFYSLEYLRSISHQRKEGVSLLDITDAAEQIGFRTLAAKLSINQLLNEVPFPLIAHWRQNHYVVVYRVTRRHVYVADPAIGDRKLTIDEFKDGWLSTNEDGQALGIALLLETTPEFKEQEDEGTDRSSFKYVWQYIRRYKGLITQLSLGLGLDRSATAHFPFFNSSFGR